MASGQAHAFYCQGLSCLDEAQVPFLVGGAYALQHYTGIKRDTKDLDVFVRCEHVSKAMEALAAYGYRTDLTFPHWLAKAYSGDYFIDIIFSSGNGICAVDDLWFEHAVNACVLGVEVQVCPPEEMIWQKAFVSERERYDGADIAHLLKACGADLAWDRLLQRFDQHWRVLMSHLILYGYIYPGEPQGVPEWITAGLARRLEAELISTPLGDKLCRGTFLSRSQYLTDIMHWGYVDARRVPLGPLSDRDIAHFTAAINKP